MLVLQSSLLGSHCLDCLASAVSRQVSFEFVEGACPSLRHAGTSTDECSEFFRSRVTIAFPNYCDARLFRPLGIQQHWSFHCCRPGRCHRMTRQIFLLIAELLCVHETIRLLDFEILGAT